MSLRPVAGQKGRRAEVLHDVAHATLHGPHRDALLAGDDLVGGAADEQLEDGLLVREGGVV